MALGLTPTIAICLTAGIGAGIALARPGDSATTADSRYESVVGEPTDDESSGDPAPGYGGIDLGDGGPPPSPATGGDDGGTATGAAAITIEGFDFAGPATVAPGATVEVTNLDGATHTLTSTDGLFHTGNLGRDATAAIVAPDAPGEYAYLCQIHPSMRGVLVVG